MNLAEARRLGVTHNDVGRYLGANVGRGRRFDYTVPDIRQLLCAKVLVANSDSRKGNRTVLTASLAMDLCRPARRDDAPGRALVFQSWEGSIVLMGLMDWPEVADAIQGEVTRIIPVPHILDPALTPMLL